WATSWGVSTRLIGGLIMTHSDDDGLILPPKLAPLQVVIVPIPKPDPVITEAADKIIKSLKAKGIRVKLDSDDKNRPGFKFAEYEMKGVPVRIGIGRRDLENNQVEIARRDTKEKQSVNLDNAAEFVSDLLDQMQKDIYLKALKYRDDHITRVESFAEFQEVLETKGGFILAHWDGTAETELKIKELTKATIRCIPLDGKEEKGKCIYTGNPSNMRVLFAQAY
ncbi:MAG TPA: His/Gly/Thr/Pro-type tRNA ligase C-terminal domain-containing protein, partial [Saprospiraceae bacterium]|nr:His/Gly/Thr/Pro-type tRNA ligase C-terminal domain-containing protein [Saprospiraceae bacterium]